MKTFALLAHLFAVLLAVNPALAAGGGNGAALVTAVEGKVSRLAPTGREPVQPFVKLGEGDVIKLERGARIRLVYFASRRQESWSGSGQLAIGAGEGKGQGLGEPEVKALPDMLVKQIARTPSLDNRGRVGMVRLRSIGTPDAVAKLESNYRQLRAEAAADDLNPEMFLLAGLLELRQLDQLERTLAELQASHPGNTEAKVLVALYQKTLKNMRESGK